MRSFPTIEDLERDDLLAMLFHVTQLHREAKQ